MKTSSLPIRIFIYVCIWALLYVVINAVLFLLNYLFTGHEAVETIDFSKGIFSVNGRAIGLSISMFFIGSILTLALYLGLKAVNRSKTS